MEHPGQPDRLDILELSGDFRRDLISRHRRTENGVGAGVFRDGSVVHREIEPLVPDQLAIGDKLGWVALHENDAVLDRELVDRNAQLVRGHLEQGFASGGQRLAQPIRAELGWMRLTAGSNPLIRSEGSVADDKSYAIQRNVELIGDQLVLDRSEALPEFTLAGIAGDALILRNGDPRIDLIQGNIQCWARSRILLSGRLAGRLGRAGDAEADNQRTRTLQQIPSRKPSPFQGGDRVLCHPRRRDD